MNTFNAVGKRGQSVALLQTRYVLAAVLLAIALLKIAALLQSRPLPGRLDVVTGMFTSREIEIVAIVFELIVARAILVSKDTLQVGLWLSFFSLITSMYKIGSFVQDAPPCGCLGVASSFLTGRTASILTWVLLGLFWSMALVFLKSSFKSRAGPGPIRKQALSGPILACCVLIGVPVLCSESAATVLVHGTFQSEWKHPDPRIDQGLSSRLPFTAHFDHETLIIQYANPAPPESFGLLSQSITNTVQLDRDQVIALLHSHPVVTLTFRNADHAWRIGSVRATPETAIFLMIRSLELFPAHESTRRLAPPWTSPGEPMSLLVNFRYSHAMTDAGRTVAGTLQFSDGTERGWLVDELLSPEFAEFGPEPNISFRQARHLLGLHEPGQDVGTIVFSSFVDVAGVMFPTRTLIHAYSIAPLREIEGRGGRLLQPEGTITIDIHEARPTTGMPALFPVVADRIHVADKRLFHQEYAILHASYTTNRVESPDVAPAAIADFQAQFQRARSVERAAVWRRIFRILLMTAFLGSGIVIIFVRYRHGQHLGSV